MVKVMKKYTKHIIIGLVTGVLNGLFGAGGGSIVVPAMEKFLDMPPEKSHATAIAIILPLSIISSVFYMRNGFFDFGLWLPVTIGGIAGGIIGARILNKISARALKIIFGIVIVLTSIRMIL